MKTKLSITINLITILISLLVISCNNEETKEVTKEESKKEIVEEKEELYHKLKKFDSSELVCVTDKFKIRIDYLGDNYRYAVWPINKSQLEKPDLILTNGKWVAEGTGGNGYYEFTNGVYKYQVDQVVIGPVGENGSLRIYKNDKLILEQAVVDIAS